MTKHANNINSVILPMILDADIYTAITPAIDATATAGAKLARLRNKDERNRCKTPQS